MEHDDAITRLQQDKAALERQDQELQELHDQQCAILDAYDGIVCVASDEHSHHFVNRRAEELTGYTQDELLGMGLLDLLPGDQREMVVARFRDRLAGDDTPRVYETAILRKGGARIPIEVSSTRTVWRGKPASLVFARDITQRKNTEKALRESEERFRLLAENAQDLICLQTPQGQYLYVSPSCRSLLGYTPEEFSRQALSRLLHPEDRNMVIGRMDQAVRHGLAISHLVYRVSHKDGRTVWFESDTVPIVDEKGRVAHLLTSARDVTQRKKMELAFSSRAKELNCLLQITELVELHRGSMEDILQKIADILPGSWQYAHVACGRIVVRDRQYASQKYRRSPWQLRAEIMVDDQNVGCVEVYYRQKMPDADDGPFTWEERRLLNAVAERLASIVQRSEAEHELQKERQALRESNIAMRELMARIQEEKREIAQAMQHNVDTVILPILEDLYNRLPNQHRRLVDVLRFNLEEVTSPFVDRVSQAFRNLSPAELRVCDMIRRGLASKEIAHVLHISPSTVSRHREHIRQKLGLTNKGTNLVSHLNAMMASRKGNEE